METATKQDRRARVAKISRHLRERRASHELQLLAEMLKDLYEISKEDLVGANPQDLITKQAECRAFRHVLKLVTAEIPQE